MPDLSPVTRFIMPIVGDEKVLDIIVIIAHIIGVRKAVKEMQFIRREFINIL